MLILYIRSLVANRCGIRTRSMFGSAGKRGSSMMSGSSIRASIGRMPRSQLLILKRATAVRVPTKLSSSSHAHALSGCGVVLTVMSSFDVARICPSSVCNACPSASFASWWALTSGGRGPEAPRGRARPQLQGWAAAATEAVTDVAGATATGMIWYPSGMAGTAAEAEDSEKGGISVEPGAASVAGAAGAAGAATEGAAARSTVTWTTKSSSKRRGRDEGAGASSTFEIRNACSSCHSASVRPTNPAYISEELAVHACAGCDRDASSCLWC
mmetsp:Transcript_56728/g.93834  ORF Transcript_56728/g.93834 Transcript_56728/m.93834 type:complete len:271 (-) Transcript_56728:309-1121(-)